MIPIPEHDSIAVKYEELIGQQQMGQQKIIIGELKITYNIKSLLEPIDGEQDERVYDEEDFKFNYTNSRTQEEKNIDDFFKEPDLKDAGGFSSIDAGKSFSDFSSVGEEFQFIKRIELEKE